MERKKRPAVGVMVSGVHASFPKNLLRGIFEESKKQDVNTFFFLRIHTRSFFRGLVQDKSGSQYDYQFNSVFDYCRIAGLDGMIVGYGTIGMHLLHNDINRFVSRYNELPLVVVPETVDLPNCSSIISDNRQGMRMLTEHLLREHGCKKILFVRGPENNTDAEERYYGYLDAMEAAGIRVTGGMIGQGDFSEFVDDAVKQLLSRNPDADAIMFSNDEMAKSGYRVLNAAGISIGSQMKVTGFDGAKFGEKMTPSLTTVFQDSFGMGIRSIQMILERLNGEAPRVLRVPTRMLLRESCGCQARKSGEELGIADYESELNRFREEAAMREQAFQEFEGKSWFIPMIAREMNECKGDDRELSRLVMEKIQVLKPKAAHLFLTDEPVAYDGISEWNCPSNLRLAATFHHGAIEAYPSEKCPRITRENGLTQLTDDGDLHQYAVFALFSGEKQYGLLVCDVPMEEIALFYALSLQIGLSLEYYEIRKREALRQRELTQNMEMMRRRNRELDAISSYDELTKLLNRRGMKERVKSICEQRSFPRAYVIYCDMDRLKYINDTFGHAEGNCAICAGADILRSCIRGMDILSRIGGDEFVCLVTDADVDFPAVFRERLTRAVKRWNEKADKPYPVEISMGVVPLQLRGYEDFMKASSQADQLMYQQKKARRSRWDK